MDEKRKIAGDETAINSESMASTMVMLSNAVVRQRTERAVADVWTCPYQSTPRLRSGVEPASKER